MTTASATTSVPSAVLLTPASSAPFTPRLEPVLSLAGDGPISDMGDHSGRIAISAAQSGGAFTLIEANVAFQGGPPPHIHTLEDETFYIVEGSFEFWVGGQIILANPGDTIFAPRHVPHAWRCVSQGGGRAFGMATPGENFEQFFVALGGMGLRGKPTPSQIADVCALGERHGLQMLPPSVLQGDSPSALVASASIAPASATPFAPRLAPVHVAQSSGRPFNAGDHWGHFALSAAQSGGAFTLLDMDVAAGGGVPPHVHSLEEETFIILEGRFEFHVDGEAIHAGPGDTVFAPRNVPHTWRCVSEDGGRALVLITPGANFESFFTTLWESGMLANGPTPEALAHLCALAERHGIQMLPPAA